MSAKKEEKEKREKKEQRKREGKEEEREEKRGNSLCTLFLFNKSLYPSLVCSASSSATELMEDSLKRKRKSQTKQEAASINVDHELT